MKINKFHLFHMQGRIKSKRVLGFRGCREKENKERKEEVCDTTYVSKRASGAGTGGGGVGGGPAP